MRDYTMNIPRPDDRGCYRFPDGCQVGPSLSVHGKWWATWADKTPLRGDNDETSFFASAEEAMAALAEGGEGPAAKVNPARPVTCGHCGATRLSQK